MPRSLETSLVEWKHWIAARRDDRRKALETSLVEWKQGDQEVPNGAPACLGNFLSGMETRLYVHPDENFPDLGNFLSGMETRDEPSDSTGCPWPWKLP